MAAVLSTRFPAKAPEFFAYQALITRAERNYEAKRWVAYDRQFRREALARKDLNWSVPDSRLYNEAFTGRAKAIARCTFCLADDHTAPQCPSNPNKPLFGYLPDAGAWLPQATPQPLPVTAGRNEACRKFNEGRCKHPRCRYLHVCLECNGTRARIDCPRRLPGGRSRSPSHPPSKGLPYPTGQPTPCH